MKIKEICSVHTANVNNQHLMSNWTYFFDFIYLYSVLNFLITDWDRARLYL